MSFVVLEVYKQLIWCLPFLCLLLGGKTPDPALLKNVRTYQDIMHEQGLHREQVCHIIQCTLYNAHRKGTGDLKIKLFHFC